MQIDRNMELGERMKGNITTLTGQDILLDENHPTALIYVTNVGWVQLTRIPEDRIYVHNGEIEVEPDQQGYKRSNDKEDNHDMSKS